MASKRPSVLVVDDDPDTRELLRFALGPEFDVTAVSNGRAALDHLRSTDDTCCIVLDLNLQGMDGVQFRTAQLRDRALAWIPIVVISGQPDAAEIAGGLRARTFLRKPIDIDELRRVVAAAVSASTERVRR